MIFLFIIELHMHIVSKFPVYPTLLLLVPILFEIVSLILSPQHTFKRLPSNLQYFLLWRYQWPNSLLVLQAFATIPRRSVASVSTTKVVLFTNLKKVTNHVCTAALPGTTPGALCRTLYKQSLCLDSAVDQGVFCICCTKRSCSEKLYQYEFFRLEGACRTLDKVTTEE